MANSYSWEIVRLDCSPAAATNIVCTIHWRRHASDGAGHKAEAYGTQSLPAPAGAPIPYAQITQAQAINWLETQMGMKQLSDLNSVLDASISAQITPPVVTPNLPW